MKTKNDGYNPMLPTCDASCAASIGVGDHWCREQWQASAEELALPGNEGLDIRNWFGFAWNREIKKPLNPPNGFQVNLGAGYKEVDWAESLDLEHGFNADDEEDWILKCPASVAAFWANGFFEHVDDPVFVLRQCEKRLKRGGVINIVVPHGASFLQLEDMTHKTAFTEESWRNLFNNPYYEVHGPWELRVHTCFIIGVAWRNLALFTQLVKK